MRRSGRIGVRATDCTVLAFRTRRTRSLGYSLYRVCRPRLAGVAPEEGQIGDQPVALRLGIGRIRRQQTQNALMGGAQMMIGDARKEMMQRVVAQPHRGPERNQDRW